MILKTLTQLAQILSKQQRRYSVQKQSAKEVIDSYWQVEKKVKELAKIIQEAKYPIMFTGAGISTSVGIPDYRSAQNTVIKTGPGLWNRNPEQVHKQQHTSKAPIDKLVDQAQPSLSHMFIATLIKKGMVKHLVSQNTDGLHMRSGIPIDKISELHGNRNLEHCLSCQRKYFRDFRTLRRDGQVYKPGQKRDHNTGRHCENCGGQLHDSIIYFGQKLPKDQLANAYFHAHKADLCICVGSSLTVKPSSNVPIYTLNREPPGKLCIVNIQQTPLDKLSTLKINYFCDDVFELLAQQMKIQIQKPTIRHYLQFTTQEHQSSLEIIVEGKDHQMKNLSFIKELKIVAQGQSIPNTVLGHKCKIQLLRRHMKDGILQINHHRDIQDLEIRISQLNLTQNENLIVEYSKVEGRQWQIKQHKRGQKIVR